MLTPTHCAIKGECLATSCSVWNRGCSYLGRLGHAFLWDRRLQITPLPGQVQGCDGVLGAGWTTVQLDGAATNDTP